jgi:hypothetical protein
MFGKLAGERRREKIAEADAEQRRVVEAQETEALQRQRQQMFDQEVTSIVGRFLQDAQPALAAEGYFIQLTPGRDHDGRRGFGYRLHAKNGDGIRSASLFFSLDGKGNIRIEVDGTLDVPIEMGGRSNKWLTVPLGTLGMPHVEAAFTSYVKAMLAPATLEGKPSRARPRPKLQQGDRPSPREPHSWMAS